MANLAPETTTASRGSVAGGTSSAVVLNDVSGLVKKKDKKRDTQDIPTESASSDETTKKPRTD